MRQFIAARICAALLSAALMSACVTPATTDPAELPAGSWQLDAGHTSVNWQVRHIGLSWYTARFDKAEASLDFDPARPEAASLTAIVDAASVSTGDSQFDDRLSGSGWLDAERHPEIVFRSKRIEVTGEETGRVHGEVTLKGVTRDAVMETKFYGGTRNPLEGREAIGFSGEFEVDRTEFGIGTGPAGNFISKTVRIRIEAEFLKAGED